LGIDRTGFRPAQGHHGLVDPDRNGITAKGTLMADFNPRTFHKAHFQQALF
jgi:hypothetical protein